MWCCLPHRQPLVLAVSTPETSLGQSQGHPGLKSFLATKSHGRILQPLQHGSCCSAAFPGDNDQPSMGSLKQGGQSSKDAKRHCWSTSLLPKHIPLTLLRRLVLKSQIHISRLPQVISLLSFSPKDKECVVQPLSQLGQHLAWKRMTLCRRRAMGAISLQPTIHIQRCGHFIATPHSCWPAATAACQHWPQYWQCLELFFSGGTQLGSPPHPALYPTLSLVTGLELSPASISVWVHSCTFSVGKQR